MSNVIRLYNFTLESENEYTKIFKDNNVSIYLSKAFDEDSGKHYLVASIPSIPEVNVSELKYPFAFDLELERDNYFLEFDEKSASAFMRNLVAFIKEENQKQKNQS